MKVLLDTHTFLWWNTDDVRLSTRAREVIADGKNEIFVSAASAWEIAIKTKRGALILPDTPETYVASRLRQNRFQALPIQFSHALHVFNLPDYHWDPFDRLLISQSQLENLPLISADAEIRRYEVVVLW